MAVYDIYLNNRRKLYEWISQQPNLISISGGVQVISCELNHTQQESEQFKQGVAERLFQIDIGDNTFEGTLPHLKLIKTDLPLIQITRNIQVTNLSTSYIDIFPSIYDGFPIPIHTIGYTKMGFILLWNKNGGSSNHSVRLVKCDQNGIIDQTKILLESNNIQNGRTFNFNINIPNDFIDFRGFIKLQAKSGNGTDNPQFDGLFLYLIRS